jgi:hypothetical protein
VDGVHDVTGDRPRPSFLLGLAFALGACRAFPEGAVVVVQTSGGEEIGASTTYGVVFAGRTASKGVARVVAFFGDGAAVETGEIEEAGLGLYTVPVEIALPTAEISVAPFVAGQEVLLAGRRDGSPWTAPGRLLPPDGGGERIETAASVPPSGALAFRREEGRWRFAGLVGPTESGRVSVLGPETLWRFLFRPRPVGPPPFPPKRPDVR